MYMLTWAAKRAFTGIPPHPRWWDYKDDVITKLIGIPKMMAKWALWGDSAWNTTLSKV